MQLINRCLIPEKTFKAYRHLLGCNEFLSRQNKYSNIKFLTSNEDCNQFRCYSGSSPPTIEKRRLPPLMSFPEIVWPSAIKTIRNWIFSNVIVTPHLDKDFNMPDFIEGAKQAVEVISAALKEGDFVALRGLVAPEAYDELHASVSKLNVAEREHLQVIRDDIYFTFPYQVGVMFEENDKRWVEITMVFHVLMGLKNMKTQGEDPPITLGLQPEYQEKLYILNYRFLREYTKGLEDSSWVVNVVNHFKLADKARQ